MDNSNPIGRSPFTLNPDLGKSIISKIKDVVVVKPQPVNIAEKFSSEYLDTTLDKGVQVLNVAGVDGYLKDKGIPVEASKEGTKNILAALALLYLINSAKKNWKPVVVGIGAIGMFIFLTKKTSAAPKPSQVAVEPKPRNTAFGVRG